MEHLEYKVIRSSRKTIGLEVSGSGVLVRAPMQATDRQICQFVQQQMSWIEKSLQKLEQQRVQTQALPPLTLAEIQALADRAMAVIPLRVRHYAQLIGVTYGRITIRDQRTKWGSCSGKGNLNFNCLLMLMPPEVVDSVVVHELCHRKEMNHSDRFYAEVLRVFPDYWKWNKWLKDNGGAILRRMTNQEGNK